MTGAGVATGAEGVVATGLVALAVGAVLLVANGIFVAVEIALLAARRATIEEAAGQGDRRARRVLGLLGEVSVTFSGVQLGITMCSLGLGVVALPALADLLATAFGRTAVPGGLVSGPSWALALVVVLVFHLVVGELAPKNLALARADAVALRLAAPAALFVAVLRPLIVVLNGAANRLVRLVGVTPVDEHRLVHTPDQLALVLAESRQRGTIAAQDARVMGAALRLGEMDAQTAMTPRVDLHALTDTATVSDALRLAEETGHTRLPVYRDDIDQVVGLVHVKDLLIRDEAHADAPLTELLRPIPGVAGARDLERLLRDMLDDRSHAVLVVDEFGGTAGMLTLEDVLEELVGEIADEFDDDRVDAVAPGARRWVVAGTLRRDEVERLTGCVLVGGEAETVSGHLVELLGRLVEPGDRVETADGWRLSVLGLEGRRAGDVEIRAPDTGRLDDH